MTFAGSTSAPGGSSSEPRTSNNTLKTESSIRTSHNRKQNGESEWPVIAFKWH
jgi:hypothetical protein